MTARRAVIGLCVMCAFLVSAFAAQGASAANNTAYRCVATATTANATFKTPDCKVTGMEPGSDYLHEPIPANTSTTLTGTGGLTKLASTISGVAVELQSTSVSGSGSMENTEVGGEMLAKGTGTINYAGVTVTKPAGKGCLAYEKSGKTNEGKVSTNLLKASTAGLTHALSFTPNEGSTFATFFIEGCSIAALNGEYVVTGSVTSTEIIGTSTKFTHANTTTQGTLKLRGQVAGIEGELNLKGNGSPLALT
jgi:hypothetical protein